jgi:2-oxoglutarate ferredoxin oxidoreductase subunit alpha
VPPFLPIGDSEHQVRLTASTHDVDGMLRSVTDEVLANTRRLQEKVEAQTPMLYDLDEQAGAETLVVTYGITAGAAREAVASLRAQGEPVSLLVARTLLPIPDVYCEILDRYSRVVVVEENLQGQLAHLLYGQRLPPGVRRVGGIGRMVRPEQIVREVRGA